MTLTPQDQTALLDFLSGMGTPKSQKRAQHLLDENAEAREYARQIRLITTAFQPPPELDQAEILSDEMADTLTAQIAARSRKTPPHPVYWFHWLSYPGSIAALLAITVCLALLVFLMIPPAPQEMTIAYYQLATAADPGYQQQSFEMGEVVRTGSQYGKVSLRQGGAALFAPDTRFRFRSAGDHLQLIQGSAYLAIQDHRLAILLNDALLTTSDGLFNVANGDDHAVCRCFAGTVTIQIGDQHYSVPAGRQARLRPGQPPQISDHEREIPDHVQDLLQDRD